MSSANKSMLIQLVNANFAFGLVWTITLLLYMFGAGTIDSYGIDFLSFAIIGLTIISVTIFGFLGNNRNIEIEQFDSNESGNYRIMQLAWTALIGMYILEWRHFGGMPMFSGGGSDEITNYLQLGFEFGLAHFFFFIAPLIYLTIQHFSRFTIERNVKQLAFFFIAVLIATTTLSRSLLINMGIAVFFIAITFNRKLILKNITLLTIVALCLPIFFQKFFFMRNSAKQYYDSLQMDTFTGRYLQGLEMLFDYIVSPVNNLIFNIQNDVFKILDFNLYVVRHIIPSNLKPAFNAEEHYVQIVQYSYNTYTYMYDYLFSFGIIGAIGAGLLFGLIFRIVSQLATRDPIRWYGVYIVMMVAIMQSIFSQTLSSPILLFVAILCYLTPLTRNANSGPNGK